MNYKAKDGAEYILNLIEEDVKAKDQLIKDIKKLRNKASNN